MNGVKLPVSVKRVISQLCSTDGRIVIPRGSPDHRAALTLQSLGLVRVSHKGDRPLPATRGGKMIVELRSFV